jgi:hypothetical protein
LVWKAMLSMTPMMSRIFCDASLMPCIVSDMRSTASPPARVAPLASVVNATACCAESALLRTVPVISSIDAAVCCRLAACDSVRDDRSLLPRAISVVAPCMLTISSRMSRVSARRLTLSWRSARASSPTMPPCSAGTVCVRSPAAMRLAKSSRPLSGRCVWRSMNHDKAAAPTALPASSAGHEAPAAAPTAISTAPLAHAMRWPRPGRSRRANRSANVDVTTSPWCRRCTSTPAAASARIVAYNASQAWTSARVGTVRTDR